MAHCWCASQMKRQEPQGVPPALLRAAALLTTGNVVSVGRQPYKILLIDVALEGAQAVRFPHVPQLQLAVCWPENNTWSYNAAVWQVILAWSTAPKHPTCSVDVGSLSALAEIYPTFNHLQPSLSLGKYLFFLKACQNVWIKYFLTVLLFLSHINCRVLHWTVQPVGHHCLLQILADLGHDFFFSTSTAQRKSVPSCLLAEILIHVFTEFKAVSSPLAALKARCSPPAQYQAAAHRKLWGFSVTTCIKFMWISLV